MDRLEEVDKQEQHGADVIEAADQMDLIRVSDCSFDSSDLHELSVNQPC